MTLEDAPPEVAPRAPRRARLVIILVSAAVLLALVFAAGAVAAPLILHSSATQPAAAPAPIATAVAATPRPTASATPTPTATPTAKPEAPADPAPVPPANAPEPAAPLPAPPAPVIPPLNYTSITAIPTNDVCKYNGGVTLTWSIEGALANSVTVRVKSGGGTPVFDQVWTDLDPVDSYTFGNVDCLRPLWYFFFTASDGTITKKALLTFADGTNKGWSSN